MPRVLVLVVLAVLLVVLLVRRWFFSSRCAD